MKPPVDKTHLEARLAETDAPQRAAERNEISHLMGLALAEWAYVEIALTWTFARATRLNENYVAAILKNVTGFSMLLNLTDSVARLSLRGMPALTHWISLREYASELYGERNYIAHQPIATSLSTSHPDKPVRVTLGPGPINLLSGEAVKIHPMDAEELRQVCGDFSYLHKCITGLIAALDSGQPLDEKYQRRVVRRRPPRKERQEAAKKADSRPTPPSPE